ncbi:MAG: hypothetical protein JOZ02_19135 [Acidobacteria bacterium]|nr:hypothetical protein [Acidobacteriota bacterium]
MTVTAIAAQAKTNTMQIKTVRTKIRSMSLDAWYMVAQIAGVILVALTVGTAAATVATGYFVGKKKDEQVRQHEEKIADAGKEIARLNAETERAKADRDEANRQIEGAKADAAKAQTETARVESEGKKELARVEGEAGAKIEAARAEAARQVGEVEKEVARQQERAAIAERALLELQERIKDRVITPEKRARMLAILKQDSKGTTTISFAVNDKEAFNFAKQLAEVLAEAGWNVTLGNPSVESTPVGGIGIFVRNAQTPGAGALQQALGEIGYPASGHINHELPEGYVGVFVSLKP